MSAIITSEMPSTPREKWIPNVGIQLTENVWVNEGVVFGSDVPPPAPVSECR